MLCYCQSGVRSGKALALLEEMGFNGASLDGGVLAWLKYTLEDLDDHQDH